MMTELQANAYAKLRQALKDYYALGDPVNNPKAAEQAEYVCTCAQFFVDCMGGPE